MNCLTEMYSAVEAEVPVRTDPSTTRNEELLMELRKARRVRWLVFIVVIKFVVMVRTLYYPLSF